MVQALGDLHSSRNVKYLTNGQLHLGARFTKAVCDSLVTEFFNVEETTFCSDVGVPQVFDSVDDRGADSSSDTVVV